MSLDLNHAVRKAAASADTPAEALYFALKSEGSCGALYYERGENVEAVVETLANAGWMIQRSAPAPSPVSSGGETDQ